MDKAVKKGLSEHSKISENEKSLGLGREGKNQTPMHPPKTSAKKGGKNFKIS